MFGPKVDDRNREDPHDRIFFARLVEVISILFRRFALSVDISGNIYVLAGQILERVSTMNPGCRRSGRFRSILESARGFVQALVFMLLTRFHELMQKTRGDGHAH